MEYFVITFSNTHSAISAEKKLKDVAEIQIMPTPREISNGCGIAIRYGPEEAGRVLEVLSDIELSAELYSIYRFSDGIFSLSEL